MQATRAWLTPELPTAAFDSPQPTRPLSVSTRTSVESKDSVGPKSLTCCFYGRIGTCSHVAVTDLSFMGGAPPGEIGRESCSATVGQLGLISVGPVTVKKKNRK